MSSAIKPKVMHLPLKRNAAQNSGGNFFDFIRALNQLVNWTLVKEVLSAQRAEPAVH